MSDDSTKLLSVEEVAQQLGICRATAFKMVGTGEIKSLKVGRLRKIRKTELSRYINARER